jgi:hypothetical protein
LEKLRRAHGYWAPLGSGESNIGHSSPAAGLQEAGKASANNNNCITILPFNSHLLCNGDNAADAEDFINLIIIYKHCWHALSG